MSAPSLVSPLKDPNPSQTVAVNAETSSNSLSENCTRIRELGYKHSAHVKLYGENFRIVSDPFPEGNGVAVRAVTATDSTERTLRLPVATIVGLKELFAKS